MGGGGGVRIHRFLRIMSLGLYHVNNLLASIRPIRIVKGFPFIDNLSLFYVLFYVCSQQVVRFGHYAFRGFLLGMRQKNAVFMHDRPTNN